MKFRVEHDPLGDVRVPADAYYGAQTRRAVENFPISGLTAPPELVVSTVQIKRAAAEANASLGRLPADIAAAIVRAADEILAGKLRDQFVVDVYQAGAGTSHNMNANETLANRAIELLGGKRGEYTLVHPNDHVNMAQSTNDTFPTAMRVATVLMIHETLPELERLAHGCALDLLRLGADGCAQTLLAQCAVVLVADGEPGAPDDLVKVLVRSTFAAHLAEWLLLSAQEYAG